MRMLVLFSSIAGLLCAPFAHADQLEDAYKAGFDAGAADGYQKGFAAGSASAGGWANTVAGGTRPGVVFPGSQFDTTIDGENVLVSPDSSIAIIPNKALGEIETRLGKDFLTNNKVLLNNRQEQLQ